MFEHRDFNEFLRLLDYHKIRYLLIGGYAVAFHGHPRYTKDLDIWIAPDESSAEKMLKLLDDFGFASLKLKLEDFLKNGVFIQLGVEPVRIDIIVERELFEEAWKNRVKYPSGDGYYVNFIGFKDLIKLKEKADRDQDRVDVKKLLNKKTKKKSKR